MEKDHALEDMMGKLGDFGRYQCFQFILHILAAMTAGMHMLSLVTVAAVPEHRCWIDGVDTNNSTADWNSSLILASIPKTSVGDLDNCLMYNINNETVLCSRWVYDTTYRTSSRAIEWNLVCDRRWMGALVQSIFMMGVLTGCIVLGGLADKFGRKVIFCWSAVFQLFFGVAVAYTPEFWSFLIFRFFYGAFGCAGCYITAFVLIAELIGINKRSIFTTTFTAFFSIGIILLSVWGALIDDRTILQTIYGLHGVVLIPHIWIMDESPRWLWAQGRIKEAFDIVEKALKCNGSSEIINREELMSRRKIKYKEYGPSANVSDLFKVPVLRKRTLILFLCWFANSQVYYGLSLSSGKFAGNPYIIVGVMGSVDIISLAFVSHFQNVWGRRAIVSSFMLLGGAACVIAPFMNLRIVSTVIVIIGKLFIAGSFATTYNYGAEIFPTIIRNSAIGLGATCARLSAAIAPFITILDMFDPKIPAVTFGVIALISGYLCLYLPETMKQPLPQTIHDCENFGKGDTCFSLKKPKKTLNFGDLGESAVPLDELRRI